MGGDDVTPTEYTLAASPFTTTAAASTLVEIETTGIPANAFVAGDYIYLQGLTGTVDGIDTTFFNNKWWQVASVSGTNDPQINGVETATAGSVSGGGSSASFYHDDVSAGGVVGASRAWGDASSASVLVDALRTVTMQNFGEDLMVSNRGGPIYYYDTSTNVTSGVPQDDMPAIVIDSTISGSTEPIEVCDSFLVSESHGHTVAFACNDIGRSTANNMLIRWSDRHNPFVWLPTPGNEAGGRVLREGSQLYGGVPTKEEIMVFTNTALYAMRYTGGFETYGFTLITKTWVRTLVARSQLWITWSSSWVGISSTPTMVRFSR